MKILCALSAIALSFTACETTPGPGPAGTPSAGTNVKYRYENTLSLGNTTTLSKVQATGYDEKNLGEVTRLDVSAGGGTISLRNQQDDQGAMYTPGVEKTLSGNLLVSWGTIGDGWEKVELAADAAGNLTVKKRTKGFY